MSIIGLNGCGKSTLLKCICNFLNYEGSIKIRGKEVRQVRNRELAKNVSILFQQNNMYFDYKVSDVIRFGRYIYERWNFRYGDCENLDIILKNMGIYHLKDRFMSELSGGEKQRVFISRILYQDPYIILLDEFNNNIDLSTQIYIIENFRDIFKDKIIVSVFHDLNLVRNLDSLVMVLKDSKIYKYGDVDSIFNKNILQSVYGVDVQKFMINSFNKWNKK
ncbi:Ferrichrome transport ATP-binding protein FhuC [Candidatus Arthromitus sp. SFB-mouse-SU]|uniref:ABC transporter ATP-binding protein n=1 Tax=Candidatus Arthromitus sp. SFB-mouse TaxID=49118 RepID=UPI000229681D|nr:ABC transporter ATP-binding protein [Candidatus Arthromitus sp. SFB-mouse]EGX29190.1 iron complex transport system ATP-binding protein [Candidatus Arthromitus sp. SFB-mouse-NYU]EIA22890.1 Ferrichrome transport ATP-binding protein FhuC [Candidatus Arthromitus sp. SFB-1]EIA24827.1 Ferrichrome transport ATP-binding protein FhuC [Candidatus Arthromitus sp. SFB-2]EIA26234.1 Ferrichrome transport ATP-binding protein FhuC [Candidatus Arthromitus sp. SFB-3]EIA29182.1 Ferrichrome transport ATP-bindi